MRINDKNKEKLFNVMDEYVINRANFMKLSELQDAGRAFYKSMEMKAWTGNKEEIQAFYKRLKPIGIVPDRLSMLNRAEFWAIEKNNFVVSHFPLPQIILKCFSSMMFKDPVKIVTKNEDVDEIIKNIRKANDFDNLLSKGSDCESYSGVVACKIIMDTDFEEYPIIEFYSNENIRFNTKYNKVYEIDFLDYYTANDGKPCILHSYYGKGYIHYELEKDKHIVKLTECKETANLTDCIIYDKNTGKPLNRLLACYKFNRGNVNLDEPYKAGEFYYQIDNFQSVDEAYSSREDLIRKAHIKTFVSETMTRKTPNGDMINPDEWDLSVKAFRPGSPEGQDLFKRDYLDVKLQEYTNTITDLVKTSLNACGISANSVLENIANGNASAEALDVREGISERTRAIKIISWKVFIKDLIELCLLYYNLNYDNDNSKEGELKYSIDGNIFNDIDLSVEFEDYNVPTIEDLIYRATALRNAGFIDLTGALKIIYKDKTDEQIEEIKSAIEKERAEKEAQQIDFMSENKDLDKSENYQKE